MILLALARIMVSQAMDGTTTIAIFGFFGTITTVLGGIIVAVMVNRSEKRQSAETAMERTLRERLVLRDEQIEDLKQDIVARDEQIDYYKLRLQALQGGPNVNQT